MQGLDVGLPSTRFASLASALHERNLRGDFQFMRISDVVRDFQTANPSSPTRGERTDNTFVSHVL